jgi:dephospho-CoA kinase
MAPPSPRPEPTARARPPFVGLTGGLGAGKSTALAALERLGAATLSTDAVVHELYETDAGLRAAVVERWGDQVAPGGCVDRRAVAERAFASPEERKWLEELLWPKVGGRMASWREEVAGHDPPPRAVVVEVPLLFESGLDRGFDATIAVVAEEQIRAGRARARGHAAVDERAARQLPQAEKARRATFAVANDGPIESLETALSDILAKLEG